MVSQDNLIDLFSAALSHLKSTSPARSNVRENRVPGFNVVRRNRWHNVELVHRDALRFELPDGVNGIISTFALSLVPEADQVIAPGSRALAEGGRWSVLDLRVPANWPHWLTRLALPLVSPFGITNEWVDRQPWQAIPAAIRQHLASIQMREFYFGATYLISGERKDV